MDVSFVARGDSFRGGFGADWSAMRYTLHVKRGGKTEVLTSTFAAGGESVCDDSGGHWTDDDADPATGLFCLCDAPSQFIPSLGGCAH
jgi:hypothetical protein